MPATRISCFAAAIVLPGFLTLAAVAARQASEQQGAIEGAVLRADSGKGIAGATVYLTLRSPTASLTATRTTTNADGGFSFPNLAPGAYTLWASADGFGQVRYGPQPRLNAPGMPITLAPLERFTNATIRLPLLGVISGTVRDESGQPIVKLPVALNRASSGPTGMSYNCFSCTSTDDRGEYRLFGIQPGRYYLSVGTTGTFVPSPAYPETLRREPGAGAAPLLQSFEFRFFPGVASIEQAVPIDVRPGDDLKLDMKTSLKPTYSIRGSIIDTATRRPPDRVQIHLSGGAAFPWQSYNSSTGDFELRNVAPGSYTLEVQNQAVDELAATAGEAAWSMRMTDLVSVRVADADVDKLQIRLRRPAAVSGRVRMEGLQRQQAEKLPAGIALRLTTLGNTGRTPPTAFVGNDGIFRADGLLEGEYLARVQIQQQGFYVKSVQYEGTDILNNPWRFSGMADSGEIEIVLAQGNGELGGTVRTPDEQPVPGAHVLLIPQRRSREDLYAIVASDQYGRFNLTNIPPGDYKLFAWAPDEEVEHYNPTYMERFEHLGQLIRVSSSSRINVDIHAITRSKN